MTTPRRRYRPVRKNLLGLVLTLAVVVTHSQLWVRGVVPMNAWTGLLYLAEVAVGLYFVVALVSVMATIAVARGVAHARNRRGAS